MHDQSKFKRMNVSHRNISLKFEHPNRLIETMAIVISSRSTGIIYEVITLILPKSWVLEKGYNGSRFTNSQNKPFTLFTGIPELIKTLNYFLSENVFQQTLSNWD